MLCDLSFPPRTRNMLAENNLISRYTVLCKPMHQFLNKIVTKCIVGIVFAINLQKEDD